MTFLKDQAQRGDMHAPSSSPAIPVMGREEHRMQIKSARKLASAISLGLLLGAAGVSPALADAAGTNEPVPGTRNTWVIMAGSTLKSTLEGWTRVAGWTLIWDSPVDYRSRASATFKGDFERSASALIDSIYVGNPELDAQFHRGNRVLHIQNQPLSSN